MASLRSPGETTVYLLKNMEGVPFDAPQDIASGGPINALRRARAHFDRAALIRQIQWLTATICGLACIPVIQALLRPLVPVPVVDPAFLVRNFLLPVERFQPEPLERLTYLVATLLLPLAIVGILHVLQRILRNVSDRAIRALWFGLMTGAIGAVVAFAIQLPADIPVLSQFFPPTPHPGLRFGAGLLLAAFILILAPRISNSWIARVLVSGTLCILTTLALFNVSNTTPGSRDHVEGMHLDAVIYSVAQVAQGRGLMVDATNQYGLYPQFLEPVFRIVGLSVASFTLTLWLLLSASFVVIAHLLWKSIKNRWLVPLAVLCVAHYSYFAARVYLPDDPYQQYHPIRFLFPCLGLYLFARYIARPSMTAYYISTVTASLAILWNPDSGLAVFGAWLALLVYREFLTAPTASAFRSASAAVLRTLAVFLSVVAAYSAYVLVRYHAWPDWRMLTVNLPVFYQYGGMMLPLPSNHPWMLVITLYVLTLARAGVSLLRGDRAQQLPLVTAVLGTGLFAYYQGRSHDNNLVLVIWPAIILLALYTDELLAWLKRPNDQMARWVAALATYGLVFFLSFSIVLIPDTAKATRSFLWAKVQSVRADESGTLRQDIQFIRRHSRPGQAIVIFALSPGVYHVETGTKSALTTPGYIELLWRSHLDELERQVAALPDVPIFIQDGIVSDGPSTPFTPRVLALLTHGRSEIDQNLTTGGTLSLYARTPSDANSPATGGSDGQGRPAALSIRSDPSNKLVGERGKLLDVLCFHRPRSEFGNRGPESHGPVLTHSALKTVQRWRPAQPGS